MAESDAHRNTFYPPTSRVNGKTDNSDGILHAGTYVTTLEACLKNISNRNPGSVCTPFLPQLYYTPAWSAQQRPGVPIQPPPAPTHSPAPAPHPLSQRSAILNPQNESSTSFYC